MDRSPRLEESAQAFDPATIKPEGEALCDAMRKASPEDGSDRNCRPLPTISDQVIPHDCALSAQTSLLDLFFLMLGPVLTLHALTS